MKGKPVNRHNYGQRSPKTANAPQWPRLPFSEEGCREVLPAAGYRNGETLNNAGSNGNYWSATCNASNANNLNFNAGNHNLNNNNRNNGRSVRPVSASTTEVTQQTHLSPSAFHATPCGLLCDLFHAYCEARRGKRWRPYQMQFENRLEDNLVALRDDIWRRTYTPGQSTCFMVMEPKKREVFAACFRDRIVHHLIYAYTYPLFMRQFVADSYSCIVGRGTHYGISRLRHHIAAVSANYTRPCYVLKLDIKGYFMHIDRQRLLALCLDTLRRKQGETSDEPGLRWGKKLDYDLLDFLLRRTIMYNPADGCRLVGKRSDWDGLPPDKSLFHSPDGCGLPIGNLTSQLFSNVYMNELDQYMKRTLHCRHYGRYVDDAYVVGEDSAWLRSLIPLIAEFLDTRLRLTLHPDKVRIVDARQGVEFLGAFIKPFRTYVANRTLRRMKVRMDRLEHADLSPRQLQATLNSTFGALSHYASYNLRIAMACGHPALFAKGAYDTDCLRFLPRRDTSGDYLSPTGDTVGGYPHKRLK